MVGFKSEVNKYEDVYQIKIEVPFAVKYVCVYLYKVDDKVVLIDAGLNQGDWSKKFFAALKEVGISVSDIDYCILTHRHIDHVGLISKLKKRNQKIKILMHKLTEQNLRWESNTQNIKEIEELTYKSTRNMKKYGLREEQGKQLAKMISYWAMMTRYQKPDKIVQNGDEIEFKSNKLRIIWTPGHSMGHICVFDQNKRYLFSGDHILSRITPHIGNFLVNPNIEKEDEYDFSDILDHYLKSLNTISELNPKIIFPAHQEVIFNTKERILEIRKHHDDRLVDIMSLIEFEPKTPVEIANIHFGKNLDNLNAFLALSEVLGHLIYLENQGKVIRFEKENKFYFSSLSS